jgi:2-C-methyl-D-erythritol 2,4-cyclodiphosphate synthase
MIQPFKIGIGYDIHRLAEGRPLILAGVRIPFDKGLVGHSDADVVAHALCDALLGAAALGDIGTHFPDSDPRFSGASSLNLLGQVTEKIKSRGYLVGNVDIIIFAERPKLAPHVQLMTDKLADVLGVDRSAVSIKAKTYEGMGAIGNGEAMASQAVALIMTADTTHLIPGIG